MEVDFYGVQVYSCKAQKVWARGGEEGITEYVPCLKFIYLHRGEVMLLKYF